MKRQTTRAFYVFVLVLAFSFTVIPVANAYIDPGSGSFIIQMLVGAALGASLAIKLFWRRIVSFFTGRKRHDSDEEQQSSEP